MNLYTEKVASSIYEWNFVNVWNDSLILITLSDTCARAANRFTIVVGSISVLYSRYGFNGSIDMHNSSGWKRVLHWLLTVNIRVFFIAVYFHGERRYVCPSNFLKLRVLTIQNCFCSSFVLKWDKYFILQVSKLIVSYVMYGYVGTCAKFLFRVDPLALCWIFTIFLIFNYNFN